MLHFYRNIRGYYYSTIRGIKNLWRWFPIVWRDRDFDNYYVEIMLYEKLRNTYNFFISKDSITNWEVPEQEQSLKALKICITILDRRLNDFYVGTCSGEVSINKAELAYQIELRDQNLLGKLLGKYLSYWWD